MVVHFAIRLLLKQSDFKALHKLVFLPVISIYQIMHAPKMVGYLSCQVDLVIYLFTLQRVM